MEQLLTILKLCLLALLYLFFLRVLRAVWVEVNGPKHAPRPAGVPAARVPVGPPPATVAAPVATGSEPKGRRGRRAAAKATQLTVVEPADQRGRVFPVADELTVGRAAGCGITVDDTYASQLHARVFRRDGQLFVEDLGSTNGTFLNQAKVNGPAVMSRGDRLQVGNTVMELS
ncbi:MAG: FHA domain-containing protein [Acidimicrobiia bacterium]|nr:FHA domain-containing protein [Acidimicrobiia bacterium]